MTIIIALLFFIVLIVVHEYGHFLAAKRNGVEVEEFGIGFPPKMAGKTMGKGIFKCYYTLNWLPLGGFVRLKGESDADKVKGGFGRTSFWVKTKIILAGVFMNLVIAWLLFSVLAATSLPSMIEGQYTASSSQTIKDYIAVGYVEPGSPADTAGLQLGDDIQAINGEEITTSDELFNATKNNAGTEIDLTVLRLGAEEPVTEQVLLNSEESDEPYLGVAPAIIQSNRYSLAEAPWVGFRTTVQLGAETYKGLGRMVGSLASGQFSEAADQVSGPVGVFTILNNASVFGFEFLIFFIAVISLTLAIMNALPIPALDGGRLFVSGIFKLFNKPLSKNTESMIHGAGFAVLMGLILLITVVDVQRFL